MEGYDEDSDNDLIGDIPDVDGQGYFSDGGHSGEEDQQGEVGDEDLFNEKDDEAVEAKPVKPVKQKKVVKNPQPKLNFDTLQGPKGLITLNNLFKDFKFKGDYHEREDLAQVMKLTEQWAYRLFPKFHFEDSLQRLESLGKKKIVQVYLKKIRMGMIESDDVVRQVDDSDDEDGLAAGNHLNDNALERSITDMDDQFDRLLSQQIDMQNTQNSQSAPSTQTSQPTSSLTQEQQERIERNKKLAEERRLAKLRQSQIETQTQSMEVDNASSSQDYIENEVMNTSDL